MHCIDDKPNGIIINHNSDWSGDVQIAWYIASERCDLGVSPLRPTPPSMRECACSGVGLIAGRFTLLSGDEPPVNVLTRVVALAVETYLRVKMMRAAEDLFIDRGKL